MTESSILRDLILGYLARRQWSVDAIEVIGELNYYWEGIGEELKLIVEAEIGKIPHGNMWGAIMNAAGQKGYIRKTQKPHRNMRKLSSHARESAVWQTRIRV